MASVTVAGPEDNSLNIAIVILNGIYGDSRFYSNLPSVEKDGHKIKEMFLSYTHIQLHENISDFEKSITDYDSMGKKIDRLHFHYCGHGVVNGKVEVPAGSNEAETPNGECLVGVDGSLYSVHDLKHKLLEFNSNTITVVLDCCRDQRRGHIHNFESNHFEVLLKHREKIPYEGEKKTAILYAALELHSVRDYKSLTRELYKVTSGGKIPIPITEIASKVNLNWENDKFGCKDDILEVGNNWKGFYWPTNPCEYAADNQNKQILLSPMVSMDASPNEIKDITGMLFQLLTSTNEINKKVEKIDTLEEKISDITRDVNNLKKIVK